MNDVTFTEADIVAQKVKHTELQSDPLYPFYLQLREIFPKGLKPGTNNPWREHPSIIKNRFELLKKHFGYELNPDEVLQTTKAYVDSFNGDYSYMRTLKYFIIKRTVLDGGTEYISDLLTYMQMLSDGETISNDNNWVADLK